MGCTGGRGSDEKWREKKKRLLSCSMLTVSRVTNNILTGNRSALILRDQVIASVNIRSQGGHMYLHDDRWRQKWSKLGRVVIENIQCRID